MARVYVARKSCGCIVAAFPLQMDKSIKGELLKQFSKAGYDVEQTSDTDVRDNFNLNCSCGTPPLLTLMERAERDQIATEVQPELPGNQAELPDGGVEQADVDALGNEDESVTGDPEVDDPFDEGPELEEEHNYDPIEEGF